MSQLIASRTTSANPTLTVTRFAGGSRPSKVLDRTLRVTVKPVIRAWRHAPTLPWPYAAVDHLGRILHAEAELAREAFALPHCIGQMVRPVQHRSGRVIVYLHGGAFLVGGQHLHRQMISAIAERTASTVLVPNYRKLPRHSVVDAIADGVHAYELALKLAARPEDVVLMGDSAGGFMTFMVAIAAVRAGLPRPAGLVAMSPFVEFKPGVRRAGHERTTCAVFPAGTLRTFSKMANRAHDRSPHRHTPMESPFDCDLAGLPPTLIQSSSSELLYPDICRLAALIGHEGVQCDLQIWDGQVHVFQAAHRVVPEAAEAIDELVDFVHRVAPSGRPHLSMV